MAFLEYGINGVNWTGQVPEPLMFTYLISVVAGTSTVVGHAHAVAALTTLSV